MDDESRFLLDLNGYLLLRGALGPRELAACRASVDRLVEMCAAVADGSAPPDAVPEGFGNGAQPGKPGSHGYANGYAWEKPLEQLVFHRRLWPIVREPPPCCLSLPTPLPRAGRPLPLCLSPPHFPRPTGGRRSLLLLSTQVLELTEGKPALHLGTMIVNDSALGHDDGGIFHCVRSNGLPPRLPVV